jgi:glc operon protein GlcG
MKQRTTIDADDVKAILDGAQQEARNNEWAVSIAVVDDGAHLLGFLRLTDATPLSAKIAIEKGRTAAMSRRESKFYEDLVKNGRHAFLSVPDLTVLEGGVPIIVDCQCLGAVGVSGVRSDQDVQVAVAGVNAVRARQETK